MIRTLELFLLSVEAVFVVFMVALVLPFLLVVVSINWVQKKLFLVQFLSSRHGSLTLIWDDGPDAVYRCDCGERFMSSACGEDNTEFRDGSLHPICPKCEATCYNLPTETFDG